MIERIEFAKVLQFVAIGINGKELSDKELTAYYFALADEFENIEELKTSAKKILKEWKYSYMPKPAHFIQTKYPSDAEVKDIAKKAYNLAKEIAILEGPYTSPNFEDPLIADVIRTICSGWFEFHNSVAYPDSNDTWIKKAFVESYIGRIKNKKVEGVKLVGYLNPKPLEVECNYTIPLKINKVKVIANNTNAKTMQNIKNLAKMKGM